MKRLIIIDKPSEIISVPYMVAARLDSSRLKHKVLQINDLVISISKMCDRLQNLQSQAAYETIFDT